MINVLMWIYIVGIILSLLVLIRAAGGLKGLSYMYPTGYLYFLLCIVFWPLALLIMIILDIANSI